MMSYLFGQTPRLRKLIVVAGIVAAIVTYASLAPPLWTKRRPWTQAFKHKHLHDGLAEPSPCRHLPGANETLVIMRTGSTELEAKLSIHLSTTLRCFPHKLIFSDAAETYRDHTIIDALSSVSDDVKENHPDFELYRRLRNGRNVLGLEEIHGRPNEPFEESWSGHTENPGWKLDKWKFLPMVNRTFHEYPTGIRWYVFIEADSYILWPSLLEHLSTLDHTQPYYAGTQVFISDIAFAHGGSGFVISPPAMRSVVEYYGANKQDIEKFTDGHWAGDCILGKFLAEAGVPLTSAWPVLQGDYPGIIPYIAPDGRPRPPIDTSIWCSLAVSYHHVAQSTVEDLWNFEQAWISGFTAGQAKALTHGDVFDQYIMPRMQRGQREDWDNESSTESGRDVGAAESVNVCRGWCEEAADCVQYSFKAGRCYQFHLPRLGRPVHGVQSGWIVERIVQLRASVASC